MHRLRFVPVTTLLTLISAAAWTLVYLDAIRLGFRDRSYGIPVAALALNIAWEIIYAVRGLSGGITLQGGVNLVWALLDLVIVYTYLRFGRAELPGWITGPVFAGWSLLLFGSAFVVQGVFIAQFGSTAAARYSAFLQNLLMSGLFIAMLVGRRGLRGQSLTIAVAKWLGTLAPTIAFGMLEHSPLILGTGLLCSVFDLVYVALVAWVRRNPQVLATGPDAPPVPAAAAPAAS